METIILKQKSRPIRRYGDDYLKAEE